MNPYAVRAMEERGIDIRDQRSKSVREYMGRMFFNFVITVCSDADKSCPQALWATSGKKLHWPFDDPAAAEGTDEEIMAVFRSVRDEIDARLQVWLEALESEPSNA